MLKKNDITGFEKEYLWVDTKNDRVFQFFIDGTGTMSYYSDDIDKPIRWEYLGENESPKNTLKIGVDGVIFYFVFKEILGEDFQVLHKSKTKSETIMLSRVVKEIKSVDRNISDTTEVDSVTTAKVKFKLKDMESSDKIFWIYVCCFFNTNSRFIEIYSFYRKHVILDDFIDCIDFNNCHFYTIKRHFIFRLKKV